MGGFVCVAPWSSGEKTMTGEFPSPGQGPALVADLSGDRAACGGWWPSLGWWGRDCGDPCLGPALDVVDVIGGCHVVFHLGWAGFRGCRVGGV